MYKNTYSSYRMRSSLCITAPAPFRISVGILWCILKIVVSSNRLIRFNRFGYLLPPSAQAHCSQFGPLNSSDTYVSRLKSHTFSHTHGSFAFVYVEYFWRTRFVIIIDFNLLKCVRVRSAFSKTYQTLQTIEDG